MPVTASETTRAFVELADALVLGPHLPRHLDALTRRAADLLDVDAGGLLIADSEGGLRLVAASAEDARRVEAVQLRAGEGPGVDSFYTGEAVTCPDPSPAQARWPDLVQVAREAGYSCVYSLPMRRRKEKIGALDLFARRPGALDPQALEIGQALADTATMGLLHRRAIGKRDELIRQLQAALDSRVVIEQAKGVLSERLQISVVDAFAAMRSYARSANQRLPATARAVVDRAADIAAMARQQRASS